MRAASDTPDEQLLLLTSHDPEAFGVFYDRHYDFITIYFARRVAADLVPDLTAETFAAALRNIRTFRPEYGSGRQWLCGIARNLLIQYFRKLATSNRNTRYLRTNVRSGHADAELAFEAVEGEDERVPALRKALEQLSPKLSQAVTLRVVDECDFPSIAAALGCSEVTARVRVHRGLSALERILTTEASEVAGVS